VIVANLHRLLACVQPGISVRHADGFACREQNIHPGFSESLKQEPAAQAAPDHPVSGGQRRQKRRRRPVKGSMIAEPVLRSYDLVIATGPAQMRDPLAA
jgi:hypothetical protein